MMNPSKYQRQYFMPPVKCMKWAEKEYVDKAPVWCSVDLRDGNQALVIPMSLEQKIEFFKLLVKIGFKEIEVGFPAASETEYEFLRTLIEQNLIPQDVTIQVLTQAREHIIRKTFEAVKGAPKAIVHVYNSTSVAQREQVFKKSKEEILKIAVDGAALLKKLADETEGNFQFEYSPESFTGTEPEYALEVCNAVLDVWQPTADNKCIINLPVTVQHSMPHVYASQVEYMCENLKYRENVIVSLHPHNDRGCGVADSEMGLLAGADRIEGTLFGNGERTGNVDIVTLGMNMYSQGVDPKLDFSDMPHICEIYEECTGMKVGERSPYSGALVFAAFSGSHQDLPRVCTGEMTRIRITGMFRIFRSIRQMWEEIMMQMLSASTASPVKVAWDISLRPNSVLTFLRKCVRQWDMPQKLFQTTNIKNFILTKFSICLNRPLRISQNRTVSMKYISSRKMVVL